MQAILLCSGRIVEIEMIPDDPDHVVVFATVYRRTVWDACGFPSVHIVPLKKLKILDGGSNDR